MTWRTLPAPDSTFGLNIFVAADDPLTVGKVRARFPGNAVWALDRPPHCNFGYNTARSEAGGPLHYSTTLCSLQHTLQLHAIFLR